MPAILARIKKFIFFLFFKIRTTLKCISIFLITKKLNYKQGAWKKKFQIWCETYQNECFFVFQILLAGILLCFFSLTVVIKTSLLWVFLSIFFFVFKFYRIPIISILICTFWIIRLYCGFFTPLHFFIVYFCVLFYFILEGTPLLKKFKIFLSKLKSDAENLEEHRIKEFYNFSVLGTQSTFYLITFLFTLIMFPEEFNTIISSLDEDSKTCVVAMSFIALTFTLVCSLIDIVIASWFNRPFFMAYGVKFLGHAGTLCTIGLFYMGFYEANTGGKLTPLSSAAIPFVKKIALQQQVDVLGFTSTTAEGIALGNEYKEKTGFLPPFLENSLAIDIVETRNRLEYLRELDKAHSKELYSIACSNLSPEDKNSKRKIISAIKAAEIHVVHNGGNRNSINSSFIKKNPNIFDLNKVIKIDSISDEKTQTDNFHLYIKKKFPINDNSETPKSDFNQKICDKIEEDIKNDKQY